MPTSWGSTGRETTRVPGGRSGSIELVRMSYGVAPATRGIPTPTTRSATAPSRIVQIGRRTSQRMDRRSREPEGGLAFMLGAAVRGEPGRLSVGVRGQGVLGERDRECVEGGGQVLGVVGVHRGAAVRHRDDELGGQRLGVVGRRQLVAV